MKKLVRVISYLLFNFPKWILAFPFILFFKLAGKHRNARKCFTISLFDFTESNTTDFFLQKSQKALGLIRERDPRRYKRVQKHIKIVVSDHLKTKMNYASFTKCCSIDFRYFDHSQIPALLTEEYACTLVHMATHGYLESKFFSYSGKNRLRMARLSVMESMRFAQNLQDSTCDWNKQFSERLANLRRIPQPSQQ